MTTLSLEGSGVTVSFSASGFSGDVIDITLTEKARETIETTHLGTEKYKTFKLGEYVDLGTLSIRVDHNPALINLIGYPAETIVISYPLQQGEVVPRQLTLSGIVYSQGGEKMKMDERMVTALGIRLTDRISDLVIPPDAPPAWSPSVLGPYVWLDGTDSATITQSGGFVSQWADKSGNGRLFQGGNGLSDARRPTQATINGKNFIDCGPFYNNLNGKWIQAANPYDAFANRVFVAVVESAAGGGFIFGFSDVVGYPFHRDGPGFGANASDPILATDYADTRWKNGVFRMNGQVANATAVGLSGGVDILIFKSAGTYSAENINGLNIDRSYRSGGAKYGEVINWDDSVTLGTTEFEKIEGYLAHKFGIASKLPADHPYKSAPP